jgi:glycosyltransferase involved in cell wall biosynthesis
LKVALNGTCFNERPSGAKQRFLGVYRNLASRMPQVEFVIYEPADCRMDRWFSDIPNIQTRPTPIPSEGRVGKLLYATRFWSQTLASERFDLFEGFHLPLPKTPTGKTLLTVHDIRRLHTDWSWPGRIAFRHALGRALKNTDLLVTVSEAMKQEVQPYCGNTPIHVIPNGLDTINNEVPSDAELQTLRRKFGLPETFLLAVGHLEQRKNYPQLIDAISYLRAAGLHCHLLIIGNDSGERTFLESRISALKLNGQITLLSGLSDLEVRCAYALCSLFVFPSTYEGFGIPILEAMAAARPMALADIPVFREITEGCSAYFSPADSHDIALTIERVLSSPQEQARLIEYGQKRVWSYAYANIGAQYERLYLSLLGTSAGFHDNL